MRIKNQEKHQSRIQLEAGGRQTGKTTRQIQWLIDNSKKEDMSDCLIYAPNTVSGREVARMISRKVNSPKVNSDSVKFITTETMKHLHEEESKLVLVTQGDCFKTDLLSLLKQLKKNPMVKFASVEVNL
jgi:hypothetical protein